MRTTYILHPSDLKLANTFLAACFTICADGGANWFYDLMKQNSTESTEVRGAKHDKTTGKNQNTKKLYVQPR